MLAGGLLDVVVDELENVCDDFLPPWALERNVWDIFVELVGDIEAVTLHDRLNPLVIVLGIDKRVVASVDEEERELSWPQVVTLMDEGMRSFNGEVEARSQSVGVQR